MRCQHAARMKLPGIRRLLPSRIRRTAALRGQAVPQPASAAPWAWSVPGDALLSVPIGDAQAPAAPEPARPASLSPGKTSLYDFLSVPPLFASGHVIGDAGGQRVLSRPSPRAAPAREQAQPQPVSAGHQTWSMPGDALPSVPIGDAEAPAAPAALSLDKTSLGAFLSVPAALLPGPVIGDAEDQRVPSRPRAAPARAVRCQSPPSGWPSLAGGRPGQTARRADAELEL